MARGMTNEERQESIRRQRKELGWYEVSSLLSTGANCPSTMWISEVEFAVATIDWMDDEIKVIGTLF